MHVVVGTPCSVPRIMFPRSRFGRRAILAQRIFIFFSALRKGGGEGGVRAVTRGHDRGRLIDIDIDIEIRAVAA